MNRKQIPNHILMPEVRSLLAEGQTVTLKVKGNSMFPFIRGGKDSVRLAAVQNPCVGDIMLAEVAPGKYCLHRLIAVKKDGWVMMGDGNLRGTEFFQKENIIGKAVAIIRESGEEVDCCSASERRKARWWYRLLPVRRWLLAIARRVRV